MKIPMWQLVAECAFFFLLGLAHQQGWLGKGYRRLRCLIRGGCSGILIGPSRTARRKIVVYQGKPYAYYVEGMVWHEHCPNCGRAKEIMWVPDLTDQDIIDAVNRGDWTIYEEE